MLTWNTSDLTAEALRQMRASDQGVSYRLLLRDNASDDDTAGAASAAFPEAEIERGEANLGFAAGMNSLIRKTTAPYVLVLNGDAWLESGALRRMVDAAAGHADAGAVAPKLLRPDGSLEHSTWPFPALWLSALYATGLAHLLPPRLRERLMLSPNWRHDRSRYVDWAVGAALLCPGPLIREIGGFDEKYFMYGEDVELCWRLRDRSYRVWFESTATVRHVGGASAESLYALGIPARKASASVAVVAQRHGRLAGRLYSWLEYLTAVRVGLMARLRRDPVARTWAATARRAHRGGPSS
jgi:GT2 family glycosyltransferase